MSLELWMTERVLFSQIIRPTESKETYRLKFEFSFFFSVDKRRKSDVLPFGMEKRISLEVD